MITGVILHIDVNALNNLLSCGSLHLHGHPLCSTPVEYKSKALTNVVMYHIKFQLCYAAVEQHCLMS